MEKNDNDERKTFSRNDEAESGLSLRVFQL